MRITDFRFRYTLLPSVGMLSVVTLFMALGFWQLERAAEKRAIIDEFHHRQAMATALLNDECAMKQSMKALLWRRVAVYGAFAKPTNILLDNQINHGIAGYFVYTPFQLAGCDDVWVLVNRGWLPVGADRQRTPAIETDKAQLTLHGNIKAPPRTGILLAEDQYEVMSDGIYRAQKLDPTVAEQYLGVKLLPYIVRLSADSPGGFQRQWQQMPGKGETKHRGYAFQWFAMATALVVIYLVLNFKRVAP